MHFSFLAVHFFFTLSVYGLQQQQTAMNEHGSPACYGGRHTTENSLDKLGLIEN